MSSSCDVRVSLVDFPRKLNLLGYSLEEPRSVILSTLREMPRVIAARCRIPSTRATDRWNLQFIVISIIMARHIAETRESFKCFS